MYFGRWLPILRKKGLPPSSEQKQIIPSKICNNISRFTLQGISALQFFFVKNSSPKFYFYVVIVSMLFYVRYYKNQWSRHPSGGLQAPNVTTRAFWINWISIDTYIIDIETNCVAWPMLFANFGNRQNSLITTVFYSIITNLLTDKTEINLSSF
jgi:hypothetical protein